MFKSASLQFPNMDGSVRKSFLRPLRPAQAMSQVEMTIPSEPKRSRQSTACTSCQKKRKRCSGSPPCDVCNALGIQCVFDPLKDKRRKLNAQRAHETVSRLVNLLQQGSDRDLGLLRESVRLCDSREQAMETLSLFLSSFSGPYDTLRQ